MKFVQSGGFAILAAYIFITQLNATSLYVDVDGTDTSTISAGISAETLFKEGTGTLGLTGDGYNLLYLTVDNGQVYVHDAPSLYLRQPVTLGIGRYTTHYTQINLEVDTGDSATITAPIIAAEVTKKGGGTLDFDCIGSIIDYLKIEDGRVIVDASDIIPAIALDLGGILDATTDLNIPKITMTNNGAIHSTHAITIESLVLAGYTLSTDILGNTIVNNLDTSTSGGTISNADTLTLNGATGSNTLIKSGDGFILVITDLSGASLPIDVVAGTMRVSGIGKLPTAAMTIGATGIVGAIFELCSNTAAGAVPGPMEIQQYATLSVDADVAVPAYGTADDVFTGGLKFDSGSILKLGAGASWARDIVVDTAL